MSKILKFILDIILFIPRLILDSVTNIFKLLILLLIIVGVVLYLGKYSINSFFSSTEKTITVEHEKTEQSDK